MRPEEIKKYFEELNTTFEEFKATNDARLKEIEAKGDADVLLKEQGDRINGALDKLEAVNAELTKQKSAAEAAEAEKKELAEQVDELEAKYNRMVADSGENKNPDEIKRARNLWIHAVVNSHFKSERDLPEAQLKALEAVREEQKALSITNDTTGGYLAPSEFVNEIIKGVTEISPARQIARVRKTVNKSVMQPVRTGQFAAVRTTEQGTRSETTGLTYGQEEIHAPEMYALIDISLENLEDSAFDMESELRMESEEQFALLEGTEFVSGSGVGSMEGILTNADIAETISGAAAALTADGIISLKHAVKTSYTRNGNFIMNRTTLGSIRKLKTSDNQYLWQPGLALGKPNTLDGDPYVEFPDMPNEGAGNYPLAYGDFRRGYMIVDRIGMHMLKDPYTQVTSGNVRFYFRKRSGGQVILAEAIRKQKCST